MGKFNKWKEKAEGKFDKLKGELKEKRAETRDKETDYELQHGEDRNGNII